MLGGLRWSSPGVAEIKRLYVRPADHGAKLGVTILQRLLADARGFGCEHVHLDTAPFMHLPSKRDLTDDRRYGRGQDAPMLPVPYVSSNPWKGDAAHKLNEAANF